ncbi:hypothetical protein TRFO_30780 [Tritrichomonas foetus]|uniref:DOCKER Lobe A domain-containing protein n=1 Tax=Tritrichomonas foetus TaxID=1144522 RepID=A0A1J4JU22_9EUKA|nr:hypothetical protein TRFO_30780 [Tritrichomonas foetus]|eukprot:OHT02210.1 hypothetical protein TRFO_30780 [Tritrichomonas foetus]
MSSNGKQAQDSGLNFKPRLSVEEDFFVECNRNISDELLNQNSSWAKSVYDTSRFNYTVVNINDDADPQPKPIINDFNLSDTDIELKDQIDTQTIHQFLQRSNMTSEETMDFEFENISKISKINQKRSQKIEIPPILDAIDCKYLKIQINSFRCGEKLVEMNDCQGVLFLYDFSTGRFASETAYFRQIGNKSLFSQTDSDTVFMEYRSPSEHVSLVCILMNQNASNLDQFIDCLLNLTPFPQTNIKQPIPFALSFINLTNSQISSPSSPFNSTNSQNLPNVADNTIENSPNNSEFNSTSTTETINTINTMNNLKFPLNWIKYTNSDCLRAIGHPRYLSTTSEFQTFLINADISVVPWERDELPEYCLSCDEKRDTNAKNNHNEEESENSMSDNSEKSGKHCLPMIAKASPQQVGDTTSSICISGLSLSFNQNKKADFVYFKAFYCNEATDPSKPIGVPKFVSKNADEPFSNVYISNPIPYSKKIVFYDFIKIVMSDPPLPSAHIIIHVYLILKSAHILSKIVIIPLVTDGVLVQSSTLVYETNKLSDLKAGEYLQKTITSSKTSLTLLIDIPSLLFPPKTIMELASAENDQLIKINEILELDPLIIDNHFIPITYKMFSLMSPLTAQYFVQMYSKCTKSSVTPQLRSWIFHNFNAKKIKDNFLDAFTLSFIQLIENSIESNPDFLYLIADASDIIYDVFLVSYLRCRNTSVQNMDNFVKQFSNIICYFVKESNQEKYLFLSSSLGKFLFYFCSISNSNIEELVKNHIRSLLSIQENQIAALTAAFQLMIQFTFTTGYAYHTVVQIPVKPLNTILYSPYQPLLSLVFLVIYRALPLGDEQLYALASEFMSRICIQLEYHENRSMIFRSAFTFFPFLGILSNYYETKIPDASKFELLPTILFLTTYTPSQLLKNYFSQIDSNFKKQFINFLKNAAEICIKNIDNDQHSYVISLFKDLTQRFLQFLRYNFEYLKDCLNPVISLIKLLTTSPYQTPRNFIKLFDFIYLLITRYPAERSLIECFVLVLTSPQHIARCFGTTLLMLYFKSDFAERKNVVVSSVQFFDSYVSALLRANVEQVVLYKIALTKILNLIPNYKNDDLTNDLDSRLSAALKITDVIMKLRQSNESPEDKCIFVMDIANSYKNFPSMRMKWLSEIVRINIENNCYSAAFVTQLHICALVATVVLHNQKRSQHEQTQFNLLITQPFLRSRHYVFSEEDFKFIPSVLVETTIDFDTLSDDFKYICSDFNINLLKDVLDQAIKYGVTAKMNYEVRCLLSIMLRIAISEKDNQGIAKATAQLKQIYNEIHTNRSFSHDNQLSFYVKDNNVFCVDSGQVIQDGIKVNRLDSESGEMEHLHCWTIFRTVITPEQINVDNVEAQIIKLTQYTTHNALPRFTTKSEIIDEKTVNISLIGYAKMEEERISLMIEQTATEFEKCFPMPGQYLPQVTGNFQQNIEKDIDRIISLLSAALDGEMSMFGLLKVIVEKGSSQLACDMAKRLRSKIERLFQVYHSTVDMLQNANQYSRFTEIATMATTFTSFFQLQEIDTKSYEGNRNPLSECMEFDML